MRSTGCVPSDRGGQTSAPAEQNLPFHQNPERAVDDKVHPAVPADRKSAAGAPFRTASHSGPHSLPAGTLITVRLESALPISGVRPGESIFGIRSRSHQHRWRNDCRTRYTGEWMRRDRAAVCRSPWSQSRSWICSANFENDHGRWQRASPPDVQLVCQRNMAVKRWTGRSEKLLGGRGPSSHLQVNRSCCAHWSEFHREPSTSRHFERVVALAPRSSHG